PLFDQQLEGQRVTLFGRKGPVPGVVAVRSTHLTRGRPQRDEPPFSVDNAYVDVGASSRDEVLALGISGLTPVSLTKRPHRYGDRLLAAPNAGRRAARAPLPSAALSRPRPRGTRVVAFTVQRLLPRWARAETDTAGNLWVRAGQGDGGGPVVIVAHLDEIGFRVDTINPDGTLGLRNRGGFIQSLFEAKPALIHTGGGDIPGI